jgi:putative glycosyltransferase (TIGR04372 family)
VASGLSHVPTTFGVPCVLTNWVSNALPVRSRRDLFIPKLIWSDAEQRCLAFDECLAPTVRKLSYCGVKLAEAGLRAVDNTTDEIVGVVREMFDVLDDRPKYTAEDEGLQGEFRAIAVRCGLVGFSRVGRGFLRQHVNLVGARARPAGNSRLARLATSVP